MSIRNKLKQESISSNDPATLREYRILRNKIKAKLMNEESKYYENKFAENENDVKQIKF